jgi:hypothetical protein
MSIDVNSLKRSYNIIRLFSLQDVKMVQHMTNNAIQHTNRIKDKNHMFHLN